MSDLHNPDTQVSMSDSQEFDITEVKVLDKEGDVVEQDGIWHVSDTSIIDIKSHDGSNDVTVHAAGSGVLGSATVTYTLPLSAGASVSRAWVVTIHAGDGVTVSAHTSAPTEMPDVVATPGPGNLPPADVNLPPIDKNLPPLDNNLPPVDSNLPPIDNTKPPITE